MQIIYSLLKCDQTTTIYIISLTYLMLFVYIVCVTFCEINIFAITLSSYTVSHYKLKHTPFTEIVGVL